MISASIKEQKSFYYFIFIVLVTAFSLYKYNVSETIFGILTIVWGLFGFYRYLYLTGIDNKKFPKILTLPSRILFGLSQQQEQQINITIDKFLKTDVLIWFIGGAIFILWGIYCSFYPEEVSLIQSFWLNKKEIFEVVNKSDKGYYAILQNISYYFMIALIAFIGISYPKNIYFSKQLRIIFLPIIFIISAYIFLVSSPSLITTYANLSHIKGIGWGQFDVFESLSSETFQQMSSGFLRRYIETGIIGAYGLYVIFIPMFFMLIKQSRFDFIIFTFLMVLLFLSDFFWVFDSLISGFQIILLAYISCFLGNYGAKYSNP